LRQATISDVYEPNNQGEILLATKEVFRILGLSPKSLIVIGQEVRSK